MCSCLISRRVLLQQALATAALACLPSCRTVVRDPTVKNFILIVADSLRRDAVSCYEGSWVKTPNLARFAKQSHVFSNAYLASFPTVPNRNDMLTGVFTFTYKEWSPVDPESVTLQEVLNANGIMTALIADTPAPFSSSYNYQKGFRLAHLAPGKEWGPERHAPKRLKLPCSPEKLRDPYTTIIQHLANAEGRESEDEWGVAQTMTTAAKYLEKIRGQRFFLYVDTYHPHEPWDAPKKYLRLYEADKYEGEEVVYPRYERWSTFLTHAELAHCRSLYAAESTLVDTWIGFLIDRIEDLGLLQDTAVAIVSDHGFYLGEHGFIGKALIRNNSYQDIPLWPEVCRIPLILYVPGVDGGKVLTPLVQPQDLVHTILDLMDVRHPETAKGRSMVPAVIGRAEHQRELSFSSPTMWVPGRGEPIATARTTISDGRNILILGPVQKISGKQPHTTTWAVDGRPRAHLQLGEKFEPEFYDLESDAQSSHNILSAKGAEAEAMRREFVRFLRSNRVPSGVCKGYRGLA